ncbi:hypothetical protein AbraIFM66951_003073 [Aspergillus brasiliensis]|uniref:ribonuclease H n=1 Tax=Aspergillus brasiliensis TaxID=319629 RepID=A0A9W5YR66_9EURO|nr:hypothetical protein AbraCBS73388_006389 [Aspergillus brasiliensis]GKZ42924.1 hypothetical protein AbraIFM66951_003073 [Aspergillus brasiliensis]
MKFERPSSPLMLDSGKFVCPEHLLEVCTFCCADYRYLREDIKMEEAHDDYSHVKEETKIEEAGQNHTDIRPDEAIRQQMDNLKLSSKENDKPRTGYDREPSDPEANLGGGECKLQAILPQLFVPPNPQDTPRSLFKPLDFVSEKRPPIRRFVRRENQYQCLVYTAGACHDEWKADAKLAKAGWSFVYRPENPARNITGGVSGRLEILGPTGVKHRQTSTRAEMRAVIAALKYLSHDGNTFDSLIVATDSCYVVNGATKWIHKWLARDWKSGIGGTIKNRDLWEALLKEVKRWYEADRDVYLWRIGKLHNQDAARLANWATVPDSAPIYFQNDIYP